MKHFKYNLKLLYIIILYIIIILWCYIITECYIHIECYIVSSKCWMYYKNLLHKDTIWRCTMQCFLFRERLEIKLETNLPFIFSENWECTPVENIFVPLSPHPRQSVLGLYMAGGRGQMWMLCHCVFGTGQSGWWDGRRVYQIVNLSSPCK